MSGHKDQWFGGETFAQHGDDLILLNLFHKIGIPQPSYIDIGAHHPFELSNTALMYARGSRGINVEANPALMKAFFKHRKHDVNLNIAIADEKGVRPFYVAGHAGRSSFLKEEVEDVATVLQIFAWRLDEVIGQYADNKWPDLLSIDIEGMDYTVLSSVNFYGPQGRPKAIIVEAYPLENARKIRALLEARSFRFVMWAGWNMIYVDHEYSQALFG